MFFSLLVLQSLWILTNSSDDPSPCFGPGIFLTGIKSWCQRASSIFFLCCADLPNFEESCAPLLFSVPLPPTMCYFFPNLRAHLRPSGDCRCSVCTRKLWLSFATGLTWRDWNRLELERFFLSSSSSLYCSPTPTLLPAKSLNAVWGCRSSTGNHQKICKGLNKWCQYKND